MSPACARTRRGARDEVTRRRHTATHNDEQEDEESRC